MVLTKPIKSGLEAASFEDMSPFGQNKRPIFFLGIFFLAGAIPYVTALIYFITTLQWTLAAVFSILSLFMGICVWQLLRSIQKTAWKLELMDIHVSSALWILDKNLNFTYVNKGVATLFDHQQKDWIGTPFKRFLNEADGQKFLEAVKSEKSFCIQARIQHQNGRLVPVEINGNAKFSFFGKQPVYQGVIRDTSRENFGQEKLRRLERQLLQAEKFKSLGLLSGSVAHDLNNILSGLATYPEVLLMDRRLEPDIESGLKLIRDAGRKASAVVGDLLTISRGATAEKETININKIIEKYVRAHDFKKIRQNYPHVEVMLLLEPELLNINGSYIHIEKSIMNLVFNAIEEVSPHENGQVQIYTENAYIDPCHSRCKQRIRGEYVILGVEDNGSGIRLEDQQKIFDPFFTKKQLGRSGTGLGLTVVQNAVKDHKGYIDILSTHKGTRIELLFPATRKEIPQKRSTQSSEEIKGSGQLILVVDDLESQQNIAVSILKNLGYRAVAVGNGYDAVDFIKKGPVDLVILDMIMAPSISGLETYRRIKEINPDQKAIIASGDAGSSDVLSTQQLGAGSFVKKPYTILDMGIAIKEELEK